MSDLAINCSGNMDKNCSFKGKWNRSDNGTPYYRTNSAIKIGGALAGFEAVLGIYQYYANKAIDKFKLGKDIPKSEFLEKLSKNKNKYLVASGLLAIVSHLGCAAFIDYKRNQKAKETADYVKQAGVKNAVLTNDSVALSNKQRAYYESNTGSKYGGWLGAACGIIGSIAMLVKNSTFDKELEKELQKELTKVGDKDTKAALDFMKTFSKAGKICGTIMSVGVLALGGWLLGKWSDNIANNDARKHA